MNPIAVTLIIISSRKNPKMTWSNTASTRQRVVVHPPASRHGWYMPRVRQFNNMTSMTSLSNHVWSSQGKNNKYIEIFKIERLHNTSNIHYRCYKDVKTNIHCIQNSIHFSHKTPAIIWTKSSWAELIHSVYSKEKDMAMWSIGGRRAEVDESVVGSRTPHPQTQGMVDCFLLHYCRCLHPPGQWHTAQSSLQSVWGLSTL